MLLVARFVSPAILFFLDRSWWAWNGWIAVGALGTMLAAGATLGTLIFFYLQLREAREQAAKESTTHRQQMELTQRQLQLAQERADREIGSDRFWAGVGAGALAAVVLDGARRWWRNRYGGQRAANRH